ncbi:hypothetical protein OAT84_01085 [Gammaproteobacteria bacterium]|nr:hypothetical protein [Gammaproteobacteria bacterium]
MILESIIIGSGAFYAGYCIQQNISNYATMSVGNSPDPNRRLGHLIAPMMIFKLLFGGPIWVYMLPMLCIVGIVTLHSYMSYGKTPNILMTLINIINGFQIKLLSLLMMPMTYMVIVKKLSAAADYTNWQGTQSKYPRIKKGLGVFLNHLHWIGYIILAVTLAQSIAASMVSVSLIAFFSAIFLFELSAHPGLLGDYTRSGLAQVSILTNSIRSPIMALFNYALNDKLPNISAFLRSIIKAFAIASFDFLEKVDAFSSRKTKNTESKSASISAALSSIHDIKNKASQQIKPLTQHQTFTQKAYDKFAKKLPRVAHFIQENKSIFAMAYGASFLYAPLIPAGLLLGYFVSTAILNKVLSGTPLFSRQQQDPRTYFTQPTGYTNQHDQNTYTWNLDKLRQVAKTTMDETLFPEISQMSQNELHKVIDEDLTRFVDPSDSHYLGKTEDAIKDDLISISQNLHQLKKGNRGVKGSQLPVRIIKDVFSRIADADTITKAHQNVIKEIATLLEKPTCSAGLDHHYNAIQRACASIKPNDDQQQHFDFAAENYLSTYWAKENNAINHITAKPDKRYSSERVFWRGLMCGLVGINYNNQDVHGSNEFHLMSARNLPSTRTLLATNEIRSSDIELTSNLVNALSVPVLDHAYENDWRELYEHIDRTYLYDYFLKLKKGPVDISDFKAIQFLDTNCSLPLYLSNEYNELVQDSLISAALKNLGYDGTGSAPTPHQVLAYLKRHLPHFQPACSITHDEIKESIAFIVENTEQYQKENLDNVFLLCIKEYIQQANLDNALFTHIMLETQLIVPVENVKELKGSSFLQGLAQCIKLLPRIILDLPIIIYHAIKLSAYLSYDLICLPVSSAKLAYQSFKPSKQPKPTKAAQTPKIDAAVAA